MAKISDLPPRAADAIDGQEEVPMNIGGETVRGRIGPFVDRTVDARVARRGGWSGFAIADPDGRAHIMMDPERGLLRPMQHEPSRHVAGKNAGAAITDGDGWPHLAIDGQGNLLRNMRNEPSRIVSGATFRSAIVDADGWAIDGHGLEIPEPSGLLGELPHFHGEGQSNMDAYQALPVRTAAPFSDDTVMFNGGERPYDLSDDVTVSCASLVPLHAGANSDGVRGQTPMTGAGKALIELLASRFDRTLAEMGAKALFSVSAQGSTPAAGLAEGQWPYTRSVDYMRMAAKRASDLDRIYAFAALFYCQGESDGTMRTSRADYMEFLREKRRDIENQAAVRSGRLTKIPMIMTQTSVMAFENNWWDIPFAQAELAMRDPYMIVATPTYIFDYVPQGPGSSGLHCTADSQWIKGYYFMRAFVDSLREKGGRLLYDASAKFTGLRVTRAIAQGDHIILDCDVPAPPIQIRTDWVAGIANWGLQHWSPLNGAEVPMLAAPRVAGNGVQIVIKHGGLRAGDRIRGGMKDEPQAGVRHAGRTFGSRTNFCDSSADIFDPSGINYAARNYLQSFDIPVE